MLNKMFDLIEETPNSIKVLIGIAVIGLAVKGSLPYFEKNDVTQSSVKILAGSRRSGGTGVILESGKLGSSILTNSHVCGLVEKGGLVETTKGIHRVSSYQHSRYHDLCLIKVKANLGINTKVASRHPRSYYEKAFISGHPSLLPNVVTSGHFSGNQIIQVMTGFKKCTAEDMSNPNLGLMCLLLGGIPIVKEYESTLVTATIMPGSSGSGVFNSDMELSGLAFAGSGSLGYAWTVPYEDVNYFLEVELQDKQDEKHVDAVLDIEALAKQTESESIFLKAKEVCANPNNEIKSICDMISKDTTWRQ